MNSAPPHQMRCTRVAAILVAAATAIALGGCDPLRHRQLLAETEFELASPVVTLPVRVRKGLFITEGLLGPDGPRVSLLIDTGAFESKLTAGTAKAAGVAPLLVRDNSDTFGRSRDLSIGQLQELRIGGIAIRSLSVGLLDWPDSAITPCLAPDGLLGANALAGLSWSADFQSPRLAVSRDVRRLQIPYDATRIDVDLPALSATPRVTATINGRRIKGLLVDLGSNGGLVLPRELLETLEIPLEQQTVIDDAASSGIYGAARQRSVRAPVRLAFGDLAPIEVQAEFTDDSSAKLGTAVLSHFRLWLDAANDELSLVPSEQPVAFADRRLPHGVLPGVDWTSDRWRIDYIEYPATNAPPSDLAVGDTFDTINGQRPSHLFDGWCDYVDGVRDWLDRQDALDMSDGADGNGTRIKRGWRIRSEP